MPNTRLWPSRPGRCKACNARCASLHNHYRAVHQVTCNVQYKDGVEIVVRDEKTGNFHCARCPAQYQMARGLQNHARASCEFHPPKGVRIRYQRHDESVEESKGGRRDRYKVRELVKKRKHNGVQREHSPSTPKVTAKRRRVGKDVDDSRSDSGMVDGDMEVNAELVVVELGVKGESNPLESGGSGDDDEDNNDEDGKAKQPEHTILDEMRRPASSSPDIDELCPGQGVDESPKLGELELQYPEDDDPRPSSLETSPELSNSDPVQASTSFIIGPSSTASKQRTSTTASVAVDRDCHRTPAPTVKISGLCSPPLTPSTVVSPSISPYIHPIIGRGPVPVLLDAYSGNSKAPVGPDKPDHVPNSETPHPIPLPGTIDASPAEVWLPSDHPVMRFLTRLPGGQPPPPHFARAFVELGYETDALLDVLASARPEYGDWAALEKEVLTDKKFDAWWLLVKTGLRERAKQYGGPIFK